MDYKESFESEHIYHIYTHGNANDLIFLENKNYYFFLRKLSKYIVPIADVLAYCLMSNHFHLLVKFRSDSDIQNYQKSLMKDKEIHCIVDHKFLMQQFSNFLNSYSKSFNKAYNRKGTLFINFLQRKKVEDESYLLNLVHYIHNNPINHGFANCISDWEFSSYNSYLKLHSFSNLNRNFILSYFCNLEDFKYFHKKEIDFKF